MSISAADIQAVTKGVTKEWTRQRKAEERGRRSRASRAHAYSDRIFFTQVADRILPGAYQHASGNGKYTVSKRQLYYAARDAFREQAGHELEYGYFANTVLVQYLNQHPATGAWKVTADPRGTLRIPNAANEVRVPCGTLAIDNHLAAAGEPCDPLGLDARLAIEWPSLAAGQRYQAVLFIEKEGFEPVLREAQIAEHFDLAILSCKGMSVVAARRFVDEICRLDGGVPLLVVHDFDKAGFEIAQRLTSISAAALESDRVAYEFKHEINVADLGLRLQDVERYKLASEAFEFSGGFASDSIATPAERAYLASGRRVELNAFTSPQFIEWLEGKLTEHLPDRLIPADDVLANAWRRAVAVAVINDAIETAREVAIQRATATPIPEALRRRVQRAMQNTPSAWDHAIYALARE